jgi:dinuclear metal center YbgI/SA1388 family protein
MRLGDIQQILESWAPKELAWERDNVGLQIGSAGKRISKILVALDVTDEVISEASRKKIDLIISHHPLLFHPLKSINEEERVGRLVNALCRQKIALYAMHTNLDFTANGVSFSLAKKLRLNNARVLQQQHSSQKKIVVFVPRSHVEQVASAMTAAGAGRIGNYEECSFRGEGVGTFNASQQSKPFLGNKGRLERVNETRLEMNVPSWKIDHVTGAMQAAHPYEEVAYDIYDLVNSNRNYGAGVLGEYASAISLKEFLRTIQRALNVPALRYSGDAKKSIQCVALCGGSGASLLPAALRANADAFVTADISYHAFQDSDNRIALIDAGHYETEHPAIEEIVGYLKHEFALKKQRIYVTASTRISNFVQYSFS